MNFENSGLFPYTTEIWIKNCNNLCIFKIVFEFYPFSRQTECTIMLSWEPSL